MTLSLPHRSGALLVQACCALALALVAAQAAPRPGLRAGLHRTPPTTVARAHAARAASAGQVSEIGYNRDIRPILSANCFLCHGPDRASRQADLRLDVRDAALAAGAIAPGQPAKSALVQRIFAASAAVRMPPAASGKTLTAAQKELLRRWIAQGAKYERHWAFLPVPRSVPVPAVLDAAWCRNPIDRFVLARLEAEKLRPSPPASRAEWLRRVTFDLTGLPPTVQEIDAFLADRSSAAYASVVDRLLASPRYGEHMAVAWLDIARYADSYGYQSDQLCPTWPYRDWVVKAFNANLPYDQFATWQIAGDMLPGATREQRLATAFNRLHRMTNEGGSVPEEWRNEGVEDRVKTFSTAFLGLTLECARCHDHKYDPISQRDHYAVSAFFDSIDEYGLYDATDRVPTPSLLLPTSEQAQRLAAARGTCAAEAQALAAAVGAGNAALQRWLAGRPAPILPDMTGSFDFAAGEGTTLKNGASGAAKQGTRDGDTQLVAGPAGHMAIALDGDNAIKLPDLGHFERHTPFTIAFRMRDAGAAAEPAVIFQACDGTDCGPYGYDLLLKNGHLTARLFRYWPGNAIAVRTETAIPRDTWTHVSVTYDGSSQAAGLHIYVNGQPARVDTIRDRLYKGTGQHELVFGQRFRDKGFKGGRIADIRIFSRSITPIEVAQLNDGHSLAAALANPTAHEQELRDYYFSAIDPSTRAAADRLTAGRRAVTAAEDGQLEVAVMQEMPAPRPTFVLARGQYDSPKNAETRVGRDVPAAVFPWPPGLRRDRLGLARWLCSLRNPLTARVEVNRLWANFFGTGIVETQEDFGTQGKPPTHPELLDWLARRFMDSSWNVKALAREIALSSAYRQASALTPKLKERDPQNALLARGPSRRLGAEEIRDLALSAAGLLDLRMGGPPVSPYQPGDLWTESNSMSPSYHQSVGGDLYRRSLYTVWKRTTPMPNMVAFDAPSREVCTARRQPTNTPLQALVLLDDVQFVEAARAAAERSLKSSTADAGRVRFLFRLLAAREPDAQELDVLCGLYREQRELFTADTAAAAKLVHTGDSKADASLPVVDLAAMTVVAQAALNLDAAVWER